MDRDIETKYEVLAIMGEGGMGSVYKVRHRYLEEIQVIKVVRENFRADEDLKARFLREARTAKKLRHPNIAEVTDYSVTSEGTAYIVMEFVSGVTLREVMRKSPGGLDHRFVIDLGFQALSALGYLHSKGFVHRDVAPDNLMLSNIDGKPILKLIDLGIAKSVAGTSNLTMDGKFVGKVQYASPEQFGGHEIDQRSDLYSLGIVLYELLTGTVPISGTDYRAMIAGHLTRPPRSFDETDPTGRVPPSLRDVVFKALQKDPDQRYQTATAFADALREVIGGIPQPDSALQQTVILAAIVPSAEHTPTIQLPGTPTTSPETALRIAPTTEPSRGPLSWRWVGYGIALGLVIIAAMAAIIFRPKPAATPRSTTGESRRTITVTGKGDQALTPTGELIIKALPWGEVLEITDASGKNRAPAGPLYTPAAMTLPDGVYKVVLHNPISKRSATLSAEVKKGTVAVCEAPLDNIDAAEYLRRAGALR
jgi:eukaryotic-like serine/threonine-protein kinase